MLEKVEAGKKYRVTATIPGWGSISSDVHRSYLNPGDIVTLGHGSAQEPDVDGDVYMVSDSEEGYIRISQLEEVDEEPDKSYFEEHTVRTEVTHKTLEFTTPVLTTGEIALTLTAETGENPKLNTHHKRVALSPNTLRALIEALQEAEEMNA